MPTTLRSAWFVIAELAPYQPVTILQPDSDTGVTDALIVLDAALGNLEMLSTYAYNVTVDGIRHRRTV
jgi:hypothetical protein